MYQGFTSCSVTLHTFKCSGGMARWLAPAAVPFRHVQVCGGNAGDLLAAIAQHRSLKDWKKGG